MTRSPRVRRVLPLLAVGLMLLMPGSSLAAVSAKSSVTTRNGATKLTVTVTSTKRFTTRTRPRAVTVKYGRKTWTLRRSGAAAVRSVWATRSYTGATGAALAGLAGKRVAIRVRSLAGTRTFNRTVTLPKGTTPTTPTVPTPPTTTQPPAQRPAQVAGDQAVQAFHAALVGQRLLWRNAPTGYTAQEAWGFCDTQMRAQYQSSTTFQDPVDYYYSVTTAFVHPTQVPQAEFLGQIARQDSSGVTYWNIAIAYGRQAGVWAEAGKSSSYEFTMSPWTCGTAVL